MRSMIRSIPNLITTVRFLLAAVFPVLLISGMSGSSRKGSLTAGMLVFTAICATDLMDGRLARRLDAVSAAGAVIDVIADLLYIVSAFVVLNTMGLVPVWFTAVIILKFVEFQITSRIIKSCNSGIRSVFVFDCFGRISAILFYIIPGIVIILCGYIRSDMQWVVNLVIYIATAVTIISFTARCINCVRASGTKTVMTKM